MTKNLIYTSISIDHNLDWQKLTSKLYSYFIIPTCHNCLKNIIQLSESEILNNLDTTDLFLNQLNDENFSSYLSSLKTMNIPDFSNEIQKLKKGSILNFSEINLLIRPVEVSISFRKYLSSTFKSFYFDNIFTDVLLKTFKKFRYFVDSNGEVNYQADDVLFQKYLRLKSKEDAIRNRLQSLLKNELSDVVQFNSYDILNDYYVIPIRSDRFNVKIGEIISRSSSGNTLFVTPFEIKDLSYERLLLRIEIDEILFQITKELNNPTSKC
jgi:DNA mismatch repair protein MutS2